MTPIWVATLTTAKEENMYLLINECNRYQLFKTEDEMLRKLKALTFEWCEDPRYEGDDFMALYHECLQNKNFGDIAMVYKINEDAPFTRFDYADVGQSFTLTRIL